MPERKPCANQRYIVGCGKHLYNRGENPWTPVDKFEKRVVANFFKAHLKESSNAVLLWLWFCDQEYLFPNDGNPHKFAIWPSVIEEDTSLGHYSVHYLINKFIELGFLKAEPRITKGGNVTYNFYVFNPAPECLFEFSDSYNPDAHIPMPTTPKPRLQVVTTEFDNGTFKHETTKFDTAQAKSSDYEEDDMDLDRYGTTEQYKWDMAHK